MGKPCLFSLSALQNLINWWCFTILWCLTLTSGSLTNFGLLFPVVCFVLCLTKLYRSCSICDKPLYTTIMSTWNVSITGFASFCKWHIFINVIITIFQVSVVAVELVLLKSGLPVIHTRAVELLTALVCRWVVTSNGKTRVVLSGSKTLPGCN